MNRLGAVMIAMLAMSGTARGQKPPLLSEDDVAALAQEISGETATRNLGMIATHHRQRGSKGFHAAAELVAGRLREYGLSDVVILQFPADGRIFYGTQRSRPAWDAEFAELKEISAHLEPSGGKTGQFVVAGDSVIQTERLLASYESEPVVLAEDSESANLIADLVDVGEGIKESDYIGKDVKGKIVLVSAQPGAVQELAVGKFRAAGIVSYAQNQKTAWSGDNQGAIRWGHLETFSANKTFALMVSLKTARGMKEQLGKGEKIQLHAMVKAGQHAGNYEVVTATIPGADPKRKDEEIVFSCHLDHQQPGANDNASGCAAILEVARTMQKLISEGKLSRPARTIRFVFPPEYEGTMALLNAKASSFLLPDLPPDERTGIHTPALPPPPPAGSASTISGTELAKRIKTVIHMDMVGGGPKTKAVFHVTRGPMSLPSFVQEVAWAYAEWVNEESYKYAATGKAEFPLVSPEGGKEPLRAEYSAYTMGSDHDVYQDSSFAIPAIYLNDWPDRFIHTNFDGPANIDPTKLKRVGFIGAASGYFLAQMNDENLEAVLRLVRLDSLRLVLEIAQKRKMVPDYEGGEIQRLEGELVRPLVESVTNYVGAPFNRGVPTLAQMGQNLDRNTEGMSLKRIGDGGASMRCYQRRTNVRGPMAVFGYDHFEAEWAKRGHATKPKLLEYEGLWGGGEEYAYEVLNFANGKRNAQEIGDAVSAEFGPVPLELVEEYLKALEEIGVLEEVK